MTEPLVITENTKKDPEKNQVLIQNIIDHVSENASDNNFKSQQKGDPDITIEERKKIAGDILNESHSRFLYKFGDYLLQTHLEYFKNMNEDDYEINFHIHRLSRSLKSKKIICKNRRYQALLELVKGDYFNDSEMRSREPLLWEQLVGQYLSPEEKMGFDQLESAPSSLSGVLFEQIDRDVRDNLKRKQETDEVISSDVNNSSDDESISTAEYHGSSSMWGEYSNAKQTTVKIGKRRWKETHGFNQVPNNTKELSDNERFLLLNEFRSHMFQKFLSGQEEDFDYNKVDNNPEYDNLVIKTIDDEEKYFDAESSDEEESSLEPTSMSVNKNNEYNDHDELDDYINKLLKNEMTDSVADKLKKL
ncbi:coiled-coil domain-containing protein 97 isoform X2 [Daktulosphaira vitifoliae]|nr:coiled-coil domain-containing protein 97 isoform X2 [Daktulosphaira vitifoliae]XP_050519746.1 coiled-coil domain-containing protein 97 isoform X2 [Daktulosphaira vitifoliae]